MSIPTRAEAITTLEEGRAELLTLLARLSDEAMTRPATIGGGDWSVKDLLGHIAFWEERASEFAAVWQAGRLPAIRAIVADGQAGIDAANARNQTATQNQSLDDVRRRELEAHARVVDMIHGLTDDVWFAKPYYPTSRTDESFVEILAGILGGPTGLFDHTQEHLNALREYASSFDPRRP